MKLENQVCSLELSKKLKSLGVKQGSLWWWIHYYSLGKMVWSLFQEDKDDGANKKISAFTVAELLEIRFNQVGSFDILVDHYNRFADTLAEKIIKALKP